jgi:ubiquinol-cytochrome c reductase cytochrome c subunit
MYRLCIFLCFVAALLAQAPKSAATGNAENGKRLFVKFGCYTCHGYQGQGGAGARIAPRPIALAALIAYVRHPSGSMPPFTAKVVTDSELTDIHAFLASVPAPPAVKDIPLLNQ